MSIKYVINDNDLFLKVISSGLCENLEQFNEYFTSIEETIRQTGHKKLLIDESLLVYKFSTLEIYKSGCFVANLAYRPHKVAILCNMHGWRDAKFWETVLVNRFILAQVFRDRGAAERWVLGEKPENSESRRLSF